MSSFRIGVRQAGKAGSVLVVGIILTGVLAADEPTVSTGQLMQAKLSLSQKLLENLAMENFPALEKDARSLADLTHKAAWSVSQTEEYRLESVEFERSAYMLADVARDKNLHATTLGYLNIVLSCVGCHKHIREAEIVDPIALKLPTPPQDNPDGKPASFWMVKKLALSQSILAALALGDAEAIAQHAKAMDTLSRIEGWARRKDSKKYRAELEWFRTVNADLIQQAEQKDFDGAALALTQVTLSCVKCHRHLRASVPQPDK